MKRYFDFLFSLLGLLGLSPILLLIVVAIWIQDFKSPLYIADRVGLGGRRFRMVKFRSMVANADASGVVSTSGADMRITPVGKFVRCFKIDEFGQLWNVLKGEMSLVGPRPQVESEVKRYTRKEKGLLEINPGVTDLASIVFADEGEILESSGMDADTAYNLLIRPWKSRLGLLYVHNASFFLDIRIILVTLVGIVSREAALRDVARIVEKMGGNTDLIEVSRRQATLKPTPPPGHENRVNE